MIWAFIIGLMLGAIFFGGLWFTVNKIVNTPMPALWVMGSFILRIGITLFGFAYIGLRDWRKLLICMAGFIIARFLVIYLTRPKTQDSPDLKVKEGIHETREIEKKEDMREIAELGKYRKEENRET